MHMCGQWQLHCTSPWGWQTPLSEHVYCVAVTLKMTEWVQQICIKFCVKLEHCSTETIQMIQKAFGDDAMSAVQIKVRHKHFEDGWESVESDPHSGRPATSRTSERVERVRAAINKDQQLTGWELEADPGIPNTTVSEISRRTSAWNMLWQNSSHGFCYQSRRNIVLQLLMTWIKLLPMNQISSRRSLLWRGLRCHCPIYNVSYIVFNKCLFSIVHGWILSGQTSYIKALSCTYALFNLNMPLLRMYYN